MSEFPIITKLGGRDAVFASLREQGYQLQTPHALRMWSVRGRIPGDAQTALMAMAEKRKVEYRSSDFRLSDQDVA